jgi:SAM-dependent methyltransferase
MLEPSAYGEAFADVYDDWYAEVSDVDGTVARLVELAAGGPVLELGVGTGRLALPLAAAGIEVHGIDASPAMVERMRAKPGADAVTTTVGDFAAELPSTPGGYAVVFVAFNTLFNLVTPGAQERCLALVVGALRPGGAFVVEAVVPGDTDVTSGVDVRSVGADEVVLSVFKRAGATVEGSFVSLSPAGGVRLRPWAILPRTPDELDALAAAAGLERESRHAGWRREPFDDDADRHVTVYRWRGSTLTPVIGS